MTGGAHISDEDLHAFIDGALEGARARAVEAALAADPALAERAAKFGGDRRMLKRIYGPLADRPVPREWIALAQGGKPALKSVRSWRPLAGAIAAALLLALGLGTWQMRTAAPGEIVEAALAAREQPERSSRIIPVAPNEDAHRYDAILKDAVAMNVKVPDLRRMGYHLIALHLHSASGSPAAEMLYRDGQGRLFSLYVRRSDGAARFDQFARGALRVCVWQDDQIGMVMAGDVSTAAMQRLASLAYTGLTL